MQDQLAETKEKYRMASGGVQERTKTLAEVSFIAIEFSCALWKIFFTGKEETLDKKCNNNKTRKIVNIQPLSKIRPPQIPVLHM